MRWLIMSLVTLDIPISVKEESSSNSGVIGLLLDLLVKDAQAFKCVSPMWMKSEYFTLYIQ